MPVAEAAQFVFCVRTEMSQILGVWQNWVQSKSFYFMCTKSSSVNAGGHCQNLVQLLAAHRTEW